MSVLIKSATVIDTNSPFHLQKMDIAIKNGTIIDISTNSDFSAKRIIEGANLYISSGWMDVHAQFNDPGFEHKEDLLSGAKAAKNGGFSTVVIASNTHPIADSKSYFTALKNRVKELPIDVRGLAALTENLEGQNFTEMYDLHNAGAIAFSDGLSPIQNPDLLKRALMYSKTFNGLVVVHPHDSRIAHGGMVNESPMSTSLGLKSDPSLSEEIMVARDLALAEYCEAPIHFMAISSAKSVELIKKAKKKGIQVTCDVAIANLIWNDSVLADFDSNFKVFPPLRSEKDRKALIKGINDGVIDAITTNHTPQNIEEKQCEFDHASFGQSSIETAFSVYNTYLSEQIDLSTWVNAVCHSSRKIFGLPVPGIHIGAKANVTVFNTKEIWEVKSKDLFSKSKNTPIIGKSLQGRVVDVIC
jgi:dihydroorotase